MQTRTHPRGTASHRIVEAEQARNRIMTAPVLGIDCSAWQTPASINWARLRELGFTFVYVRGVKMGRELDVHAVEHVKRARDEEFSVGLYSFFDHRHSVDQQLDLAAEAHERCGIGVGDRAPALDVESTKDGPQACRAWVEPVTEILDGLEALYQSALRYHNVNDWIMMGKPDSLLRWPLWLADYSPPADLPCVIWQQRSAPIAGYGDMALDQNAALGEIPTIGPREDAVVVVEPSTLLDEIQIPWPRWSSEEHNRIRNEDERRKTDTGWHDR